MLCNWFTGSAVSYQLEALLETICVHCLNHVHCQHRHHILNSIRLYMSTLLTEMWLAVDGSTDD